MKTSIKFNKVILYTSIVVSSFALLLLAINIFYLNSSIKEDLNIGLIGIYLASLLIMFSQHFEIKHKNNMDVEKNKVA